MNSNSSARLICAILLVTAAGCTTGGVSLRPDGTPKPEACPEKAREAMDYLRMFVGESAWVQLDANQSRTAPITLYEGPIESVLDEDPGLLEAPSRLYGQVWTDGPQAVIRYYEAQPVRGGRKMPICAVARLGWASSGNGPSLSLGLPSSAPHKQGSTAWTRSGERRSLA